MQAFCTVCHNCTFVPDTLRQTHCPDLYHLNYSDRHTHVHLNLLMHSDRLTQMHPVAFDCIKQQSQHYILSKQINLTGVQSPSPGFSRCHPLPENPTLHPVSCAGKITGWAIQLKAGCKRGGFVEVHHTNFFGLADWHRRYTVLEVSERLWGSTTFVLFNFVRD